MQIVLCVGQWSRNTPSRPALLDGNTMLDYRTLDERVEALAQDLTSLGVGRGDVVAVALPLGVDAVVGTLGVVRAGAAFLPLDMTAPVERNEQILRHAAAIAIVDDRSGPPLTGPSGCRHVELAEVMSRPLAPAEPAERRLPGDDDPAYVLFTSGSTGEPKGIRVSHGNLDNYLRHADRAYRSDGNGACLVTQLTFDLSITCLFLPLLRGEPLRVVSEEAGLLGLRRLLVSGDPLGVLKLTPSHLRLLSTMLAQGALTGQVSTLVVGGEALYAADLRRWRAESPSTTIINEYGPTEATVGVSVYDATAGPAAGPVPIGAPIDGVELLVVDEEDQLVPDGSPGELVVTGRSVAGYLEGTASTAYGRWNGTRCYRSGDRVVRHDGVLEYLGRRDDQVKLSGHRVELGEVEAALRQHQGVHDAAAAVVPGPAGNRLVAFVVMPNGEQDVADVLRVAREVLLPVAVPERLELRAELPRTVHGKVDRQTLVAGLAVEDGPAAEVGWSAVDPRLSEPDLPGGDTRVAVVGFDCVFPGAPDAEAFWNLLISGREGITTLTDAQLLAAGVSGEEYGRDDYVRRAGVIDGIDQFDADFFGLSAAEARLMDPQHRLLMHSVWRALEHAGRASLADRRATGVFTGVSANTYLYNHLLPHRERLSLVGSELQLLLCSEKDFAPSRIAYALQLEGPAIAIQSGCSTGLTGVHLAVQSLLTGEAATAVVAAACVRVPHEVGSRFREGSIVSARGVCRAFDAEADGCVQGNGVASVVLRLLADAQRDGDTVYAVIRGTAINNDGRRKVGYAAPSVAGQRDVLVAAQEVAGVSPSEIAYVEAHGTGTALGDPVEAEALGSAFGDRAVPPVAVGSVKTNIGHLDTVAGLAGLLKVVLSLHHGLIPPSLNFTTENPRLPWSPRSFKVQTELTPWPSERPCAGVSAFSVGGANAHAILSRAPARPPRPASQPGEPECVVLSGRRREDLLVRAHALADHLERKPHLRLADVAYTLRVGWDPQPHRGAWVATDIPSLVTKLRAEDGSRPPLGDADATSTAAGIAQRWVVGADLPREAAMGRARVGLPGLPLHPLRHWAETDEREAAGSTEAAAVWAGLLTPQWHAEPRRRCDAASGRWLVLAPEGTFGAHLVAQASARGHEVLCARPGAALRRLSATEWEVGPDAADLERLLGDIGPVDHIVHAWLAPGNGPRDVPDADLWSVLRCGRALARSRRERDVHLLVVVSGAFGFAGYEPAAPLRGAALGPVLVLPQEVAGVSAALVDVQDTDATTAASVVVEAEAADQGVVALRGSQRYRRLLLPFEVRSEPAPMPTGTWLVTGGFGGVGGEIAGALADGGSTLILLDRPESPASSPDEVQRVLGVALARELRRQRPDLLHDDPELVDRLTVLTVASVVWCLGELGLSMAPGAPVSAGRPVSRLGVEPGLARMVDFMVGCLRRAGLTSGSGDDEVFVEGPVPDRTLARERVAEWAPDLDPLLRFVARCVDALPDVLSGRRSAVEVLYPAGDATDMEAAARITMARSLGSQQVTVLADWIADLAARSERRLRVLEIGAGNGLLTDQVLERVTTRGLACEYVATDIGQTFVARLARRYAGIPGFRTAMFDASRPAGEQGLDPAFDIVVGLNVVHATRDVEETVRALRSALKPGGHLALLESVRFEPWVDLVAGLATGWWLFDDQYRTVSPLLDVAAWERVFAAVGFDLVAVAPRDAQTLERADCALLVARAPGRPEGERARARAARVADLVRRGARVQMITADLTVAESVAAAVAEARAAVGPIDGLVHCAAEFRGGLLSTVDELDQQAELGAKALGALHLLESLADQAPRWVVLASSMNVHLGGEGQAAYVAANGVLAALAERYDREGSRVVAVDWGRWDGVGHAARFEAAYRRLGRGDLLPGLRVSDALAALRLALDSGFPQVAVPDRTSLAVQGTVRQRAPSRPARATDTEGLPVAADRGAQGTLTASAELADQLVRLCSEAIGQEVGLGDRLSDLGADSIVVLELQGEIESVLGVHIMTPALLGQTLEQLVHACAEPHEHPGTVRPADGLGVRSGATGTSA